MRRPSDASASPMSAWVGPLPRGSGCTSRRGYVDIPHVSWADVSEHPLASGVTLRFCCVALSAPKAPYLSSTHLWRAPTASGITRPIESRGPWREHAAPRRRPNDERTRLQSDNLERRAHSLIGSWQSSARNRTLINAASPHYGAVRGLRSRREAIASVALDRPLGGVCK